MKNQSLKDINLNEIKAIIFDFDGVLAESMNVKTEAFAKLFEKFGSEIVEKVVKHHIENGGISRYKKIRYYYSEYLNKKLDEEEVNKIAKDFSKLVLERVIKSAWVPGAKEFLDKNFKKIDFFVASGTPQEELNLIIEKRNMNKYFKKVYGTPKTKPEIIKKIIRENKYDCKKIIFIGDTLSDCKDAEKTKIIFLGRVTTKDNSFFPEEVITFENFKELI